jgi:hypothetical protein
MAAYRTKSVLIPKNWILDRETGIIRMAVYPEQKGYIAQTGEIINGHGYEVHAEYSTWRRLPKKRHPLQPNSGGVALIVNCKTEEEAINQASEMIKDVSKLAKYSHFLGIQH